MSYYQQAVLVLGMHRSGTSAVAGTAVRLGLAGPKNPLPASDDNPGGFYEPEPVFMTNFHLLLRENCAWNLCFKLEPSQLAAKMEPSDRQKNLKLLLDEFGDTQSFVLKEPRLCVTLPVWLPALEAMGAAIRVLLVLRHPAEVVRSLKTRNNLPAEETAPLWLFHMLEAERISRQFNRAVLIYDDLLRDWRHCMRLAGEQAGIFWPTPIAQAGAEIDAFLTAPSGRPRNQDSARLGLPPVDGLVEAAWNALLRLVQNPKDLLAQRILDEVNDKFTVWRRAAFPPESVVHFGTSHVRG